MSKGDMKAIVWLPKGISVNNVKELALWAMNELTDKERDEVMNSFCRLCGNKNLPCNCWRDE